MRRIAALLFLLPALAVGACGSSDLTKLLPTEQARQAVVIGMSESTVINLLGDPAARKKGPKGNLNMLTFKTLDGGLQVIFLKNRVVRECPVPSVPNSGQATECDVALQADQVDLPK